MAVTKTDNQHLKLKKNLKKIYNMSLGCSYEDDCPVRGVFAPAVDKWSLFCLYNLAYNEVLRFNKLKAYVPGISSRMLSVTLKKLETAGLVEREVYAEVPPKVEYRLTKFGYEFAKRLAELNIWTFQQKQKLGML